MRPCADRLDAPSVSRWRRSGSSSAGFAAAVASRFVGDPAGLGEPTDHLVRDVGRSSWPSAGLVLSSRPLRRLSPMARAAPATSRSTSCSPASARRPTSPPSLDAPHLPARGRGLAELPIHARSSRRSCSARRSSSSRRLDGQRRRSGECAHRGRRLPPAMAPVRARWRWRATGSASTAGRLRVSAEPGRG